MNSAPSRKVRSFIGLLVLLFAMSPVVSTVCAAEMAKVEQQESSSQHDHASHHHNHSNSSHPHHNPEQDQHQQQCCGDQLWDSHTGFFKFFNWIKQDYSSDDDSSDAPGLSSSAYSSATFQFPPGTLHLHPEDRSHFHSHQSLFSQKVSLII